MSADSPLSMPLEVAVLPPSGRHVRFAPGSEERAALARHLGIPGVEALDAHLEVVPTSSGRNLSLRVTGRFSARLRQVCGVSLQEIDTTVEGEVVRAYATTPVAPLTEGAPSGRDIHLDPEAEDPPDPIADGRVDLGVLLVEELALAMDPFPRAPGVAFDPPVGAGAAGESGSDDDPAQPQGRESPFAVLEGLRKKTSG